MDQQNPYAAPQTIAFADEATRLPTNGGTDFQPVAQGAGYCHDSLMTMVSLVIAEFVLFWFYPNAFVFTLLYVVPIIVVIAWVLQLSGLVKLCQVPRESGARGLFSTALVLFGLSLLSSLGMWLILLERFPLGESMIWIIFNSAIFRAALLFIRAASLLMLLWGAYRIGRFVERPEICRWSQLAFGCLVFVTALESILFFPQAMVTLEQKFSPEKLETIAKVLFGSFLLAVISGLVFYAMALKSLTRLEGWIPAKAELSSLIGLTIKAQSSEEPLGEST